MTQGKLFDGPDVSKQDTARLSGQLFEVKKLMADGAWRTLGELVKTTLGSEAGVSARLRDLRKPRFGGHHVERRKREGHGGLWEYRLLLKGKP